MNTWNQYGFDLARQAVDQRKDVFSLGKKLGKNVASSEGQQTFDGFIFAAIHALSTARRAGVEFSESCRSLILDDPNMMYLTYRATIARKAWQERDVYAKNVLMAFEALRRNAKNLRIGSQPKAAKSESEPAKNEPLEVRVVAMPDRKTTTFIDRNAAGDMAGSTQFESDVTS